MTTNDDESRTAPSEGADGALPNGSAAPAPAMDGPAPAAPASDGTEPAGSAPAPPAPAPPADAPPAPAAPAPAPRASRPRHGWISVTTTVLGVVVLVVAMAVPAFGGLVAASRRVSEYEGAIEAGTVRELAIETRGTSFAVHFDAAPGTYRVRQEIVALGRGSGELEVGAEGGTFTVADPDDLHGGPFASSIFAEIHLPAELEGALDLAVTSAPPGTATRPSMISIDGSVDAVDAQLYRTNLALGGDASTVRVDGELASASLDGTVDSVSIDFGGQESAGKLPFGAGVDLAGRFGDVTIRGAGFAQPAVVARGTITGELAVELADTDHARLDFENASRLPPALRLDLARSMLLYGGLGVEGDRRGCVLADRRRRGAL